LVLSLRYMGTFGKQINTIFYYNIVFLCLVTHRGSWLVWNTAYVYNIPLYDTGMIIVAAVIGRE